MRGVLGVAAGLAVLVAGGGPPARAADPPCRPAALGFAQPVSLTGPLAAAYEPGVKVDSQGTIYVTAHKGGLIAEPDDGAFGARGASWLFRSTDGGRTFTSMDGLMGATRLSFAFEGDIAIDARDRMYFADLTLADNHFYRYSDRGATLDFYRPLLASAQGDDRPWLAAHHDGIVYYLSNARFAPGGNVVLHRSTDGGQTFGSVGFTFPGSGLGHIAADPNSDDVYVFGNDWLFLGDDGDGAATKAFAWTSRDRGGTWRRVDVFDYETGDAGITNENGMIGGAVSPADGSAAFVEVDGGGRKLLLARSTDRGDTWSVTNVAPFPGRYATPWVAFSNSGEIGLIFEADPDDPAYEEGSFVFAMVWRPAAGCTPAPSGSACRGAAAVYGRVHPTPTNLVGPGQADFFQLAFTPDGAIVTAYADHAGPRGIGATGGGPMFFARQTSGPNLSGSRFCGVHGPLHPSGAPAASGAAPDAPPTTAPQRVSPAELRVASIRWRGRRLALRALLAPRGAPGRVTLRLRGPGVRITRRLAPRDGNLSASVRLPARARRARLELSYPGAPGIGPARIARVVRRR